MPKVIIALVKVVQALTAMVNYTPEATNGAT